jgi:hypothetical protein
MPEAELLICLGHETGNVRSFTDCLTRSPNPAQYRYGPGKNPLMLALSRMSPFLAAAIIA